MRLDATIVQIALLAGLSLSLAVPATAQQLENKRTRATSGTTGAGTMGRASGANLSAGSGGPASETSMPAPVPQSQGRGNGSVRAGASDETKELFEH